MTRVPVSAGAQWLVLALFAAATGLAQTRAQLHASPDGDAHFSAARWADAAASYRAVLAADPGNAYAWFRLGVTSHRAGEHALAADAFRRASAFPGYRTEAPHHLARALTALGRADEAVAALRESVAAGRTRADRFTADPDLLPLREHPLFRDLVRSLNEAPFPPFERYSAWSPDGSTIVFDGARGGSGCINLYAISPDGTRLRRLTNSAVDADMEPTWSPDGSLIAFVRNRVLTGGTTEIWLMRPDGTEFRRLTRPDNPTGRKSLPSFSPDSRRVLFVCRDAGVEQIYSIAVDTDELVRLTLDAGDKGNPTLSPDGSRLMFDVPGETDTYEIMRLTLATGEVQTVLSGYYWWDAHASPDGTRIAAGRWQGRQGPLCQIAVTDIDGNDSVAITPDEFDAWYPRWSPDGTRITFSRSSNPYGEGGRELWIMNADGTDRRRLTPP